MRFDVEAIAVVCEGFPAKDLKFSIEAQSKDEASDRIASYLRNEGLGCEAVMAR